MKSHRIETLLDVGANQGQFASEARLLGFDGLIHSFEPLPEAYEKLREKFKNDSNWQGHPLGLGAKSAQMTLNVSQNGVSSSLHPMQSRHELEAPESAYIKQISVQIKTLDEVFPQLKRSGSCYLKIDTQGHELAVLEGGKESLKQIRLVQLELSMVELYAGELRFQDMLNKMSSLGFRLVSLEPGFYSAKSGELLQVDGVFANEGSAPKKKDSLSLG